jgi:hypothetical protein
MLSPAFDETLSAGVKIGLRDVRGGRGPAASVGMPVQPQLVGPGRPCGNTLANSEAICSRIVTITFLVCQSNFWHDSLTKLSLTVKLGIREWHI